MKSGTTYLSDLLGAHPGIFMSAPKEPCHFVDGKSLHRVWPYMWKRGYWRSLEQYLSLFAGAADKAVIGEASTFYSYAPLVSGVAQRITAFNPQARFIYVMRDPVERSISHYWQRVRFWGERRPMLQAMRSDPQYTDVGHYARQLKEYLRHVERERLYVLTHEALLGDTVNQLSRVYNWLNVNPAFRPKLTVRTNSRPERVFQVRGYGLLERLRRSAPYAAMAPHLPEAARHFGHRLALREVRPDETPIGEVQAYLRSVQTRQTEELSTLLNRSFPEWHTLQGEENCTCWRVSNGR